MLLQKVGCIIDPLVLPGLANCFKVTFRFVSAQGQDLGDASKAVVVAKLVLDDRVVVGNGLAHFLWEKGTLPNGTTLNP